MPTRAKRPCAHPACSTLVDSGRCEEHRRERAIRYSRADARRRGTARERGYDRRWEKVRAMKMSRDPLCETCRADGRTKAADMVHHIEPVRERPDLRLAMANLRSLCWSCHAEAHA